MQGVSVRERAAPVGGKTWGSGHGHERFDPSGSLSYLLMTGMSEPALVGAFSILVPGSRHVSVSSFLVELLWDVQWFHTIYSLLALLLFSH